MPSRRAAKRGLACIPLDNARNTKNFAAYVLAKSVENRTKEEKYCALVGHKGKMTPSARHPERLMRRSKEVRVAGKLNPGYASSPALPL